MTKTKQISKQLPLQHTTTKKNVDQVKLSVKIAHENEKAKRPLLSLITFIAFLITPFIQFIIIYYYYHYYFNRYIYQKKQFEDSYGLICDIVFMKYLLIYIYYAYNLVYAKDFDRVLALLFILFAIKFVTLFVAVIYIKDLKAL